ncbi:phosphoribosylglycinamide formyltransferase [Lentibacillus lipolyticus]|nr:phosphoribosylglycinamide formyltransferase [Lentibacillus lipolyticus]
MKNVRAAVFASGTGSNFQAIMDATDLPVDVVLLVCDRSDAVVIDKAKQYGIETYVLEPKRFSAKEAYEQMVLEKLRELGITWLFLAGYMRIVGTVLLTSYRDRIINIHPSLLPDFPGKDAIGQAYRAAVGTTGVTVHYVDEGIDTGPIIAQQEVVVKPDDTLETLTNRVHQAEHHLYPAVIRQLLGEKTQTSLPAKNTTKVGNVQ